MKNITVIDLFFARQLYAGTIIIILYIYVYDNLMIFRFRAEREESIDFTMMTIFCIYFSANNFSGRRIRAEILEQRAFLVENFF